MTKLSMSTCQLSIIFRTFAADWKNRDVAQLVAHYVRDVGVACSSHVIPTRERGCVKIQRLYNRQRISRIKRIEAMLIVGDLQNPFNP